MICPACRGSDVYSSHRQGVLERGLLTWVGILPYRCGQCRTRFYRIAANDPRRHRKGGDIASAADRPRPPRWGTEMAVEVTLHTPGQASIVLHGIAKNASLEGARIQLPTAVPEGSLVSVRLLDGLSRLGSVRWNLPQEAGFLHGVHFQIPLDPGGVHARPLRRLRLRRIFRRALIVLIGSLGIAAGAYGLNRFIESLRTYEPSYYEPKDVERQVYEWQRLKRPRQTPQPSESAR